MPARRPSLLVTGATGNVGREVIAAALRRGLAVTAAHHAPERAALPAGVPVVPFDFRDPSTWTEALRGHDRLFLLRPPAISDVRQTLHPFVDAALRAGVGHIVFLSVAGAGENRFVPHHAVEKHLSRTGEGFTALRPGFFAQNLQDAYRRDLVEDDRLYVPAGRAPVNWVDVRDVAELAVRIAEDPAPHRGQHYTLAGPGPVAWDDVARQLSTALGRSIRYVPASVLGYVAHLRRRRGLPWAAIAVQTLLHVLLRVGQGAREDPTLERLLGRRPGTIRAYVRDHAALWARPSP